MEVLDKGKAAAVTTIIETRDKTSGKLIFENQSTVSLSARTATYGIEGRTRYSSEDPVVLAESELAVVRLVQYCHSRQAKIFLAY